MTCYPSTYFTAVYNISAFIIIIIIIIYMHTTGFLFQLILLYIIS